MTPVDVNLREQLDKIAVEVSYSKEGDFLKVFAQAWQLADPFNKRILKPAWLILIEKYGLEKFLEE